MFISQLPHNNKIDRQWEDSLLACALRPAMSVELTELEAGPRAQPLSEIRPKTSSRKPLRVSRVFREPLVHFLFLGLALYVFAQAFGKQQGASSSHHIEVSSAEIKQLKSVWASQWNRDPNPQELKNLVAEFVREDVLYREAIASGLDRDDSIIRRRLVQKMQFLMQDPSLIGEPTDAQLLAWFRAHSQRYAEDPAADFTHIFFSRAQRGTGVIGDAQRELRLLQANKITPANLGDVGDAFISGYDFKGQADSKLKQQFGASFAEAIGKAALNSWAGPVASPFGIHLIWVSGQTPGKIPAFAAVRSQVLADYMNDQTRSAEQQAYAKLLSRYDVRVDAAPADKGR
jgi:peptidyl-prolyl cis-trans isomerase C